MNCEKIEQLIALYVEGDATREESSEVERHIDNCANCREFIGELRESQQSLKFAGRVGVENIFDEALLRNLRQSVMMQITEQPVSLWQRFSQLFFNWRFATAMTMLLILSIAAVFYLRDNQPVDQSAKKLPIKQSNGDITKSTDSKSTDKNSSQMAATSLPGKTDAVVRQPKLTRVQMAKARVVKPLKRDRIIAAPAVERGRELIPAVAVNHDAPMGNFPEEKLKMEIHTADPNVRIIWFTAKPANPLTPS